MKKQFAWILGGGSVVALAMVTAAGMTACSPAKTGEDGGSDAGMDVMQQQDVVQQDMGTQESGPTCKSNPTLHMTAPGNIFCGYLPDGGPSFSCDAGADAASAEASAAASTHRNSCAAFAAACNNGGVAGLPLECQQTADCTANSVNGVCCLQGVTGVPQVEAAGCPPQDLKLSGGTGIKCEQGAACAMSGDLQICSSNADCGDAGKVCTPFRWKITRLATACNERPGFCAPRLRPAPAPWTPSSGARGVLWPRL